jgi:hypothetical protein
VSIDKMENIKYHIFRKTKQKHNTIWVGHHYAHKHTARNFSDLIVYISSTAGFLKEAGTAYPS